MTDDEFHAYRGLINDDRFRFYELDESQQALLLGKDVGTNRVMIVVELDEITRARMYGRRYGVLELDRKYDPVDKALSPYVLSVFLGSCDDGWFEATVTRNPDPYSVKYRYAWQIRSAIGAWLQRVGFYLNAEGLASACSAWGNVEDAQWTS